ncbi:unknown [Clostridium sp. CAG:1013]|jgi:hypothetical protein|nr:unknown [Clostridium sp. CAG:1013]
MKQCPTCGLYVQDQAAFCPRCGADMTHVPQIPPQAMPQNPMPLSPPPQGPAFIPPQIPVRRPFTWADVSTFLGFCASIVGYFGASLLFFPLGIVASVLGFKGERAKGLAVAGIVIATLGLLLKLMTILELTEFLPWWFTSGVW